MYTYICVSISIFEKIFFFPFSYLYIHLPLPNSTPALPAFICLPRLTAYIFPAVQILSASVFLGPLRVPFCPC